MPHILTVAAVLLTMGLSLPAFGEDFRIENSAYMTGQKEPPSQSVTIFHQGVVYDSMKTPAETVVFEQADGRFVLLNAKSKARAELTTSELAAFSERLRTLVGKSTEPVLKFLAAPKFQERFDDAGGVLTLSSPWLTYRVVVQADASQDAAEQYREFSDWYVRLNALLSPGSRPPFARLEVNAALAQQKALPSEVTLTLAPNKSSHKPITVHSTHRIVRPLPQADLDRVTEIRRQTTSFKLVSFERYRKLESR